MQHTLKQVVQGGRAVISLTACQIWGKKESKNNRLPWTGRFVFRITNKETLHRIVFLSVCEISSGNDTQSPRLHFLAIRVIAIYTLQDKAASWPWITIKTGRFGCIFNVSVHVVGITGAFGVSWPMLSVPQGVFFQCCKMSFSTQSYTWLAEWALGRLCSVSLLALHCSLLAALEVM